MAPAPSLSFLTLYFPYQQFITILYKGVPIRKEITKPGYTQTCSLFQDLKGSHSNLNIYIFITPMSNLSPALPPVEGRYRVAKGTHTPSSHKALQMN
jgi:hypothetical protein